MGSSNLLCMILNLGALHPKQHQHLKHFHTGASDIFFRLDDKNCKLCDVCGVGMFRKKKLRFVRGENIGKYCYDPQTFSTRKIRKLVFTLF